MGEAKRRGTFEQRKAIAIKRNAKILKEQKLAGVEADAESRCILENPCSDDTPGECDNDCIYFRTA